MRGSLSEPQIRSVQKTIQVYFELSVMCEVLLTMLCGSLFFEAKNHRQKRLKHSTNPEISTLPVEMPLGRVFGNFWTSHTLVRKKADARVRASAGLLFLPQWGYNRQLAEESASDAASSSTSGFIGASPSGTVPSAVPSAR